VNTNNGVKWRIFIVPKKVEHSFCCNVYILTIKVSKMTKKSPRRHLEQINDHLFIYILSNNIKIGVNDRLSEMCVR